MDNQIENNINNEDEISLIDLFAVLIRYRKLIIIGSFITVFLAGLYLFVLPLVVPTFDKKESIVTYNVIVDNFPVTVERQLNVGRIPSIFMAYVRERPFFSSVYKNHLIFSLDGKMPETTEEFNEQVVELFEDGKFSMRQGTLGETVEIILEVPQDNMDKTEAFVADLVTQANERIKNYLYPRLEDLRKNTKETIAVMEQQTTMIGNSTQELQRVLADLESYMASLEDFVQLEDTPFILPVAQGRLTKLVIVAFAGFFVFIFIAFVLNAIKNVKADPQASKVISDAWKAGK